MDPGGGERQIPRGLDLGVIGCAELGRVGWGGQLQQRRETGLEKAEGEWRGRTALGPGRRLGQSPGQGAERAEARMAGAEGREGEEGGVRLQAAGLGSQRGCVSLSPQKSH